MDKCAVNFTGVSKGLAESLYGDLVQKGVTCKELDSGYAVVNYAGIHCPDKSAKSCTKGSSDGVVQAEEVLEYAIGNYEKYREIVEGRLGAKLPWLLDDFDPSTDFDAGIRKQVQNAITEVKRILTAKGLKEESPQYQEILAVGLHWFVAFPMNSVNMIPEARSVFQKRLRADGLEEFFQYLTNNGGLRVEGDYSEEYTALEALDKKQGECTETSKILFATLKLAGLNPLFVHEDILKEENSKDPLVRQFIENFPKGQPMFHVTVGVYGHSGLRLLDAAVANSNADYQYFTQLSLREYLSFDYSNRSAAWNMKGNWDNAISDGNIAVAVNPEDSVAYSNRAAAWSGKGNFDKALSDTDRAIAIDPKYADNYYNRGTVLVSKGTLDVAILDFTRAVELNPKHLEAYFNRGSAWNTLGNFVKAIADYTKVIELNPKYAKAYFWRAASCYEKGNVVDASNDFAALVRLTKMDFDNLARELLSVFSPIWERGKNKRIAEDFKKNTDVEIGVFEAKLLCCYVFWLNKDEFMAKLQFNSLESDLLFNGKPSRSTKQFILKLLGAMPKAMRQNRDVQEVVKTIRRKI